ncbi:MAG: hypothetical protein M1156_01170 [Candidatus Marsarchaeota archaeon]|nr:hypothetical protein [Candidatus Marsarchaeota archaeon]
MFLPHSEDSKDTKVLKSYYVYITACTKSTTAATEDKKQKGVFIPTKTTQAYSEYDNVPESPDNNLDNNPDNKQNSAAPEASGPVRPTQAKNGSATIKYAAIIIVVLAVLAVAVYFLFLRNSSGIAGGSAGSYSVLVHNQSIFALASVIKQGYSSQQALNASYRGTISISYLLYNINLPFTLTMQKYGNDSSEHISIPLSSLLSSFPGIQTLGSQYNSTLSLSTYDINNNYYLCVPANSIASSILTNGYSTYTSAGCIKANETSTVQSYASIGDILLPTLNKILNISVLNYSLVQSTYSGNSCSQLSEKVKSDINLGMISSLLGGSASSAPSLPSFPININTCLSNSYYGMPYSMNITMPDIIIPSSSPSSQQSSSSAVQNATLSISLLLNSNYINNEVMQQDVSVLPYPLVNISSSQGSFGSGPTTTIAQTSFSCVAKSGFICDVTSYSNGYLNAEIGQLTTATMRNTFVFFLNNTAAQEFQSESSPVVPKDAPISYVGNSTFDMNSGGTFALSINTDTNFTDIPGEIWIAYNKNASSFCGFYNNTGCIYQQIGTLLT